MGVFKEAQIRLLHCRSSPISHCLSKRLLKHFSRWQNLSILVCFLHYFYLEHSILVISWPFRPWLDLIPIFSWNMSSWKVNLRIFTPIILMDLISIWWKMILMIHMCSSKEWQTIESPVSYQTKVEMWSYSAGKWSRLLNILWKGVKRYTVIEDKIKS